MKEYKTGQKLCLLSFMKKHPDQKLTIDDIAQALRGQDGISISSIYRNMKKMVSDGSVKRSALDGSRKFAYQYIGDGECSKHLHLQCEICGKLIHLDDKASNQILESTANNNFSIDKKKTIIYGSCNTCGQ